MSDYPTREKVKQLLIGTPYEGGEYLYWDFNLDDHTSHTRATIGNYNRAGFMMLVDAMRNAAMVQNLRIQLADAQAQLAEVKAALRVARGYVNNYGKGVVYAPSIYAADQQTINAALGIEIEGA